MPSSILRERKHGQHAPVTNLELFFDLVFVFAITQLSHALLHHLTPLGAVQAGVLLLAVWWAWIYTTWVTNWLDPSHPAMRLMLFVLMGVGLILSTSLSAAFEQRALPFAVAYVTIQVGRSLFMLWAGRGHETLTLSFQRISAWLAFSGVIWIGGAFAEPYLRLLIWMVALAFDSTAAAVGYWIPGLGRSKSSDWDVEGAHMAERCGLFVIICLGESILVTGATFATLDWTPQVLAAAATAFLGTVAMWWIYFSSHAEAASEAISESDDPGRIARVGYTYLHLPIVAGIIVSAAGDELLLAHPAGHVALSTALVVIGGPALFLAGALAFKFSVFRVVSTTRATGLAMMLALVPAVPYVTPLLLAALVTAVLAIVGGWETILRLREPVSGAAVEAVT